MRVLAACRLTATSGFALRDIADPQRVALERWSFLEKLMRTALKLLVIAVAAATAAGCHKTQQQPAQQNISIDNGVGQNAQVEELPSDESSGTSSNELMKGSDNPDVNATEENDD